MKNTFGNSLTITLFGESHQDFVGIVADGVCPGLVVDEELITLYLNKRRPDFYESKRREKDEFKILSGVFNGKTTGTPLTIVIKNNDTLSTSYQRGIARPSHCDYTAYLKYHGFEDYRGGGHFSGRLTAPIVALGAILMPYLNNHGISIGTHILKLADFVDRDFSDKSDIDLLNNSDFPVLEYSLKEKMIKKIENVRYNGDSIGGVIQTGIFGIKKGLGEPYFDSIESLISHAMFSVGSIKGIEFGKGFSFAKGLGSELNDELFMENGEIYTKTNNNGGITGGITNGMPILFNCVVKPTPSIKKEQDTVDFIKNENTKISVKGRHDSAIIRRICPVTDSLCAIVIADILSARFGTDYLIK